MANLFFAGGDVWSVGSPSTSAPVVIEVIVIAMIAAARKRDGGSEGKPTANTSKALMAGRTIEIVSAITANVELQVRSAA